MGAVPSTVQRGFVWREKLQAPLAYAGCLLSSYASSLLSRVERLTGRGGCFDRAASTDLPSVTPVTLAQITVHVKNRPTRERPHRSAEQSYWLARAIGRAELLAGESYWPSRAIGWRELLAEQSYWLARLRFLLFDLM